MGCDYVKRPYGNSFKALTANLNSSAITTWICSNVEEKKNMLLRVEQRGELIETSRRHKNVKAITEYVRLFMDAQRQFMRPCVFLLLPLDSQMSPWEAFRKGPAYYNIELGEMTVIDGCL